jgi:hypothetical protein
MTSLLTQQDARIYLDGQLVVLKIGTVELKMDHTTAIKLSTWLRIKGKAAKSIAGDTSTHWSVIGNLTAVEAGNPPWD